MGQIKLHIPSWKESIKTLEIIEGRSGKLSDYKSRDDNQYIQLNTYHNA